MARAWPPALVALLVQITGALTAFVLLSLFVQEGPTARVRLFVILAGALSLLLSRLAGQPAWWQVIHLIFLPLIALALHADLPANVYLIGFFVLLLTSFGALRSQVPLYLSSARAHQALVDLLPREAHLRFLDLGCGLGGVLAAIRRARPDAELTGVDAAPLPWLISRLRLAGQARIRLGSLWDEDLSRYQVVYAYLSPAPMARLWQKVRAEMQPGSLFISNTFEVPGSTPERVVELNDLNHSRLLLWRI